MSKNKRRVLSEAEEANRQRQIKRHAARVQGRVNAEARRAAERQTLEAQGGADSAEDGAES